MSRLTFSLIIVYFEPTIYRIRLRPSNEQAKYPAIPVSEQSCQLKLQRRARYAGLDISVSVEFSERFSNSVKAIIKASIFINKIL